MHQTSGGTVRCALGVCRCACDKAPAVLNIHYQDGVIFITYKWRRHKSKGLHLQRLPCLVPFLEWFCYKRILCHNKKLKGGSCMKRARDFTQVEPCGVFSTLDSREKASAWRRCTVTEIFSHLPVPAPLRTVFKSSLHSM